MKGQRDKRKLGTVLFFIPIILVVALVAYAIIGTGSFRNGTLIVRAQTSSKYYATEYLNVTASVVGRSGITPFTLSLSQGTYVVTFPSEKWFVSPPPKDVNVTSGGTSFVVGVYDPIPVSVSVGQGVFNTTRVAVLHKVTPLIWVNPSLEYEVISSSLTGRIVVAPLQNFTYVFQNQGTFAFSFVGTQSPSLEVTAT